jgi:hypothetical protein
MFEYRDKWIRWIFCERGVDVSGTVKDSEDHCESKRAVDHDTGHY